MMDTTNRIPTKMMEKDGERLFGEGWRILSSVDYRQNGITIQEVVIEFDQGDNWLRRFIAFRPPFEALMVDEKDNYLVHAEYTVSKKRPYDPTMEAAARRRVSEGIANLYG